MKQRSDFEVKIDFAKRTIYTRMKGLFSDASMQAWAEVYKRETDRFGGRRHMVIADMRGMRALYPSVGAILAGTIAYARRNGVVLCAHITDDIVQRLQAKRLARQNSLADEVTVDVASIEEAKRVLDEARSRLDNPDPATIRAIG